MPRELHLVGDGGVLLQVVDAEFGLGVHQFRLYIAQFLQQIVVRVVELRLVDAFSYPVFRHVEYHIFIVGSGADVVVMIAQRLVPAGIVNGAALAPRTILCLTIHVGLHTVDVWFALQVVVAARRISIPRQVGSIVKLSELCGERVGCWHHWEHIGPAVGIGVFPVVVARVFQTKQRYHFQVYLLRIAHIAGDFHLVGFLAALLTFEGLGLIYHRVVLSGK